ncbi:glycosyltransferase family 2 protein [Rathayibacter sp. CAU 1779]
MAEDRMMRGSEPSVTVVMTARDAQRTIRTAVVSTLRALPADGRMIVRDDGSSDGTVAVLNAVNDPRLTVVGGTALGIPGSRNDLLGRVKTEYVAQMDADDISLPYRFASAAAGFHKGADFVFAPVIKWKSGTPLVKPQAMRPIAAHASRFHLLIDNPFMQPTMVARTKAVRALGGYHEVASEDYELWLRASTAGYAIVRLSTPSTIYRLHQGQTTAQASRRARQSASPMVHEAFDVLAHSVLGFFPCWFEWRRDGFPTGEAPSELTDELDAFLALAAKELAPVELAPVRRRVEYMKSRARA